MREQNYNVLPYYAHHVQPLSQDENSVCRYVGYKAYELSDHLGNVRVTVSDLKPGLSKQASVLSYSNYYAFGSEQPGRHKTNTLAYRYGFNGMEKDDEVKGEGNSYTTEFRQYDPRLARWLTLDPLMMKYPGQSPYVAFNNNPVYYKDPKGLEGEEPKTIKELRKEKKKLISGLRKKISENSTDYMKEVINTEIEKVKGNFKKGIQKLRNYSYEDNTPDNSYKNKGGLTPKSNIEEFSTQNGGMKEVILQTVAKSCPTCFTQASPSYSEDLPPVSPDAIRLDLWITPMVSDKFLVVEDQNGKIIFSKTGLSAPKSGEIEFSIDLPKGTTQLTITVSASVIPKTSAEDTQNFQMWYNIIGQEPQQIKLFDLPK